MGGLVVVLRPSGEGGGAREGVFLHCYHRTEYVAKGIDREVRADCRYRFVLVPPKRNVILSQSVK